MGKVAGILALAIMIISMIFFIAPEVRIVWITYLGIPLVILTGSVGVAFITKRFEAIICGMVISALLLVLFQSC